MTFTTDSMVDALTRLLCADAKKDNGAQITGYFGADKNGLVSVDSGTKLRFPALHPKHAVLLQHGSDRVMTENPELLCAPIQDVLGIHAEAAVVSGGCVRWIGVERLFKAPKGVWLANAKADVYAVHVRSIYSDGANDYRARVSAFDKSGKPALAVVEGSKKRGYARDLDFATVAASIIDDSRRPEVIRCTVSDAVSLTFPVSYGEHLELFKLREGPLSPSLRRRALLHRVAAYQKSDGSQVARYERGIKSFDIDGLSVSLEM